VFRDILSEGGEGMASRKRGVKSRRKNEESIEISLSSEKSARTQKKSKGDSN